MTRLIQIKKGHVRRVALVEEPGVRLLDSCSSIYELAHTAKPARTIKTPWYNLDNIHWSGDHLLAAGMMFDEPACGGTRKQIQDAHGNITMRRRG